MSPTRNEARTPGARFARASSIIRGVTSRPTTRAPAASSANAMSPVPVARSSARVSGPDGGQRDQPPLPSPVAAVRQQARNQIVAVRDRREQPPHVAALAFRRGDVAGEMRHDFRCAFGGRFDNIPLMLPSSTVENYLKAIYQGQAALPQGERLVPMGQVATSLGVTPGTATTMVKALAESGLAEYEPYSGVRLTSSGENLAGLVLRRHRLVELFLVQVMGMSWAEVHDEAEQLEHVVSERLIERIDEMLGRPTHDPHGDPIPTPDGSIVRRELDTLLTCPLGVPLRVTRIADQDPAFLRFLEQNEPQAGTAGPGGRARRGGRLGAAARPARARNHDRHARGIEASGRAGGARARRLNRAASRIGGAATRICGRFRSRRDARRARAGFPARDRRAGTVW